MTGASHQFVELVMPYQTGWIPSTLHVNASLSPRERSFHTWADCVREDISMIKSTIPPQDLLLMDSSLIWLKIWLVAKQRLICWSSSGAQPSSSRPLPAQPQQSRQAFTNGWLFEPLAINISVSQTINIIYILPNASSLMENYFLNFFYSHCFV